MFGFVVLADELYQVDKIILLEVLRILVEEIVDCRFFHVEMSDSCTRSWLSLRISNVSRVATLLHFVVSLNYLLFHRSISEEGLVRRTRE